MPELLERKRYSSDLDDAEWGLIEPLLPPLIEKGWGAPCRWHRRDVVDAIIYVIKTGCPWRDLPGDFPPWNTVWKWFCRWRKDGTWARAHDALRAQTRVAAGRDAEPSLALLDSQTVKGTEYTTPQRPPPAVDAAAVLAALTAPDDPAAAGVTAEQIATAVLGPHHGVPAEHVPAVVAAAIVGVGEGAGAAVPKSAGPGGVRRGKEGQGTQAAPAGGHPGPSAKRRGARGRTSMTPSARPSSWRAASARWSVSRRSSRTWPTRAPLIPWVFELSGVTLEIVQRAEEAKGFVVQKWRWIVERTHAWLGRFRRLSRCFERLTETDETLVHVAMIRLMLRRIAHPERETWRGTIAFAPAA
jgi:transposase